jgi:hypothetical protein
MIQGNKSTEEYIILGGLGVQIIFFGFFLASALIFQRRIARRPTPESANKNVPWQKHMFALHFTSIPTLIRPGFRAAEYIQGSEGFLLRNEVFMYVYDGLLMFFVTVVFLAIHPSEVNCLLGRGETHDDQMGSESPPAPFTCLAH